MIEWIITSSLLILLVVALRALLKGKVKPILQYALWGIVLLRLLVPFSFFESSFSIMNIMGSLRSVEIAQTAEELGAYEEFVFDANPPLSLEIEEEFVSYPGDVYAYHNGDSDRNFPLTVLESVDEAEFRQLESAVKAQDILIPLYFAGVLAVLAVFLWTNLRFGTRLRGKGKRKLDSSDALLPVYVSPNVETPCLFGIFSPKIYVTPDCAADERSLRHVLAHESTHYRHGDNIWGALRCLALALHWYNPLVWWAAMLSKRDAELACDEGALRRLGDGERADYGRTLIALTCARGDFRALALNATTMTGSKKSIKERITFIAQKPKMALYALAALILAAAVAVCCTFSGADSGFSDREARKEARPLAESVAMANSCRIEGRAEILRYEGAPAEADPETNVQYVRVSYPTRNGLQKINVEFCMTDSKGQHYDEPFSAASWLSRSYTQIVPVPADYIESVHIWRRGYANPVIPEAYREEIKEYVTKFFYADEYPTGALMGSSLNDAGFTVFMKDGSSVSFGMDYAKIDGRCYKIAKPEEMPDWLTELLTAPGKMEMEYHELIKVDDSIKAKVDPYVISYAVHMLDQQIGHYIFDLGIDIIEAKLTALEPIHTGAADQYGNAVEMYRVEYRLLPENIDDILPTEDRKMEDGWLTEWSSEGQPYMLFYLQDGSYREILRFINTEELDATYSTEIMLERYGNKYTAATMEILKTFIGRSDHEYRVMLAGEDYTVAPYYHMKHARTYVPVTGGWLSASGTPLDPDADIPTVTISDDRETVPDDYTELNIIYNRFVVPGELCIRDENFEIMDLSPQEFYIADDLYTLPVGIYYVTFDIRVLGEYISELGEHEQTVYTCIFRLIVVDRPSPPVTVTTEIMQIDAYNHYWGRTNFTAEDTPVPYDRIQTIVISDDPDSVPPGITEFDFTFPDHVSHSEMRIYDDNSRLLSFGSQVFYEAEDLYALPVGNYYVAFDRTITHEADSSYQYQSDDTYVFRLVVVEDAFSEADGKSEINLPLNGDMAMCMYAWPVVLENIFEWLPTEDIKRVANIISESSFTEISENDDAFNPQLAQLYSTGNMADGDQLDRYVFIHPYDYREELEEKLNSASREELEALTKPLCILVHDYNIEKQQYFAYVIFDGKYYMADIESELRIMTMFEELIDKYDAN